MPRSSAASASASSDDAPAPPLRREYAEWTWRWTKPSAERIPDALCPIPPSHAVDRVVQVPTSHRRRRRVEQRELDVVAGTEGRDEPHRGEGDPPRDDPVREPSRRRGELDVEVSGGREQRGALGVAMIGVTDAQRERVGG